MRAGKWVVVVLLFWASGTARAGFSGGVETFDGTVKDTATWREQIVTAGNITQNNALQMNAFGGRAEYTADGVSVGIGQSVRAEVTITAADPGTSDGGSVSHHGSHVWNLATGGSERVSHEASPATL
ncbi:MAG TPA: hypothetical protein VH518_19395 [Tepidisphaeraceae bacterium]|jgi:hypothetical protein